LYAVCDSDIVKVQITLFLLNSEFNACTNLDKIRFVQYVFNRRKDINWIGLLQYVGPQKTLRLNTAQTSRLYQTGQNMNENNS